MMLAPMTIAQPTPSVITLAAIAIAQPTSSVIMVTPMTIAKPTLHIIAKTDILIQMYNKAMSMVLNHTTMRMSNNVDHSPLLDINILTRNDIILSNATISIS